MPTPVGVARQCLAEAAAAVLDDAVAVAKRRGHAQTTSLHAVSALLALPSSALREACARARSSACAPRLQFRALELCVGVALDRISASKSTAAAEAEPPPVSNSLMAAIKRSQANQRRHPETFHLYQMAANSPPSPAAVSAVKVELKHFVMSILDDPIVSRVFDDAGFRTHEIKLAILNPLAVSRFSSSPRPPPLFSCSFRDFELSKFPPNFAANPKFDDSSRRISEILLAKHQRRNPLLIGASAAEAYKNFVDFLTSGEPEALPKEISGLRLAAIEREFSGFINGDVTENLVRLKLREVEEMVEDCEGPGMVLACGDMKAFAVIESVDAVIFIVAELKKLLSRYGAKVRLIGFLASDGDYSKMVKQVPTIESDWDLHLLTITGKCFTSSLMRSFVPFGGLFPMPSELESLSTVAIQPSKLCKSCNEKCEQEINAALKGQPTDSVTNKQSANLSSYLQIAACETSKVSRLLEAKEDKALLDARVLGLRRKWSDICERLHCTLKSQSDIDHTKPHTSTIPSLPNFPIWKDTAAMGLLSSGSTITNLSPSVASDSQKNPRAKQDIREPVIMGSSETNNLQNPSNSCENANVPVDYMSSPSVLSVTTDLRLGTFYDPVVDCRSVRNLQDDNSSIRNSELLRSCEKSLSLVPQSPPRSCNLKKSMCIKDLEHPWKVLAKKVYWQAESIQTISRAVSRCRNGYLSNGGNVWLGFSGPDKVGKRKIAASVAEIVFGRKEHLLRFDLNAQDMSCSIDRTVDCCSSEYHDMKSGRKMAVDYLAEELRKHPHSVVLLENVEKADFLVRQSLSQAVKTGKFPDSCGRDINVNNIIFVLASTIQKGGMDPPLAEFPEEKILEARNLQMRILVESTGGIGKRVNSRNVLVSKISDQCKRKLVDDDDSTEANVSKRLCSIPRCVIDLNLPVLEENGDTDEDIEDGSDDDLGLMWFEELLEHMDENVLFKPFNFDFLNQKILKEIDIQIKKAVRYTSVLEIHRDVMAQILAATWLTDEEDALKDWIEHVLCGSIQEARRIHRTTGDFVAKLIPCDGLVVEAQATGIRLPGTINLN